jgi:predicted lysophospholipase L1 biosynthesis ABC-type transport system permease subunit
LVVVVRPKPNATGLPDRLRKAAFGVHPRALVERVRPGSDWLADTVINPRRRTVLLSLLGGLGLLLTLIGVFGMTATPWRRTQEIGVRIAFGATARDVGWAMLADAMWPVTIGLAIGLTGAWFATRLISTFLFETTATDAPTFVVAACILGLAALTAVWIPARRAARVDPVKSLRVD